MLRTKQLSEGQQEALAAGLLALPVSVLAFAARGSEGALRQAGRNGAILGSLVGAGVGTVVFVDSSSNERLENTAEGTLVAGAGAAFIGMVLTLAWKAVRLSFRRAHV